MRAPRVTIDRVRDNQKHYVGNDHPAWNRLIELLTEQMDTQSRRWGFPVGQMEGRINGMRVGVQEERDAA
jgi:hypothetical protein